MEASLQELLEEAERSADFWMSKHADRAAENDRLTSNLMRSEARLEAAKRLLMDVKPIVEAYIKVGEALESDPSIAPSLEHARGLLWRIEDFSGARGRREARLGATQERIAEFWHSLFGDDYDGSEEWDEHNKALNALPFDPATERIYCVRCGAQCEPHGHMAFSFIMCPTHGEFTIAPVVMLNAKNVITPDGDDKWYIHFKSQTEAASWETCKWVDAEGLSGRATRTGE